MRLALPSILLAMLLALALGRVERSRMPQLVLGDDALSVAFADAKSTISSAMLHKADSYFHGGIDMECPNRHECKHADCDGHDQHEHDHDNHRQEIHAPGPQTSACDPWHWINSRIRAPEKHVHLDGEKAVEMMPWFWASIKADPHNVEAWTTAWYAANAMLKDRALARRILDDAKVSNPDSLDIAWAEARFVYDGGKGDAAAAERLLQSARAMGKRKCGGDLSQLSPHEAETFCGILDHLSALYAKRGDHAAIKPLVEEARATGADTPVIGWMLQRAK